MSFTSVGHADACTPGPGVQCFVWSQAGTSGSPVPFGSVEVDTAGNVLTFKVDVSPDFSITTGSHHGFAFAIGPQTGTLTGGAGTFGPITQAAGGSDLQPVIPTGVADGNPPFGNFNFFLDCVPGGGNNSCGDHFSFTFTVTSGHLIPSTGNSSVWFAADVSAVNVGGSTGAVGATQTTGVPLPLAGAGLPGLIVACGAMLALARRRRSGQLA